MKFSNHIQRRTTVGRTPLDEWSARRRNFYLTINNTHNRQTSMPPVGLELRISAGERPQTYALDCAATGTGKILFIISNFGLKQSARNLLQLEAFDFWIVTFLSYPTYVKIWAFCVIYCLGGFIVSSQNEVQLAKCKVRSHNSILRKWEENSNEIIKENSYSFFFLAFSYWYWRRLSSIQTVFN